MKAAVFYGPGDVRYEDVPDPVLESGDILLRIKACGICGSDLHTYRHGLFEDLGVVVGNGRVMGHEFSGEIASIDDEQSDFKIGDRVVYEEKSEDGGNIQGEIVDIWKNNRNNITNYFVTLDSGIYIQFTPRNSKWCRSVEPVLVS